MERDGVLDSPEDLGSNADAIEKNLDAGYVPVV